MIDVVCSFHLPARSDDVNHLYWDKPQKLSKSHKIMGDDLQKMRSPLDGVSLCKKSWLSA